MRGLNEDQKMIVSTANMNPEEWRAVHQDSLYLHLIRRDIVVIGDQHILVDYKTTDNAETEAFRSSAIKYGYDLQAGMYLEGYKANTGQDAIFLFIAQEKKEPYAINILQADEFMVKEGKQLFHDLMDIYHECKVKVQRFLELLKRNDMIQTSVMPEGTVISVLNYSKYQGNGRKKKEEQQFSGWMEA